ncbi:glycoside hydrolase family 15 protein [Actinomadura parmotrematis]|uniref:glycoside hydrolase family 15 protein n=1 Tax=Actinomadura parmotrematis TaxID=2864039 RepID=UPI0027E2F940|nr:glycoside hydrolase family 15 protein [Actinomadura parmotrematis]
MEDGARAAGFPPIGSYGFLSDCRTAALTAPDGAVEWMCAPRFDGPSVFNRILDRGLGGSFTLAVEGAGPPERAYTRDGLVLESRWRGRHGTAAAADFLAVRYDDDGGIRPVGALVRIVRCEQGEVTVRGRVAARPDHARRAPVWRARDEGLLEADAGLRLTGLPRPAVGGHGDPEITAELAEGGTAVLILDYAGAWTDPRAADDLLAGTLDAWRRWSARSDRYDGYAADRVRFSAIVLRGLIHSESGALIAAPTTSLPEWIGGERNWDYRYAWHRDAALALLVLMRLGHREEAARYLRFLLGSPAMDGDRLKPMLTLDGGTRVEEEILGHLSGYARSAPVRIGNKAFDQFQIDVYGQVLDAALVYQQVEGDLTREQLGRLFRVVDALVRVRHEPDDGLWEARTDGSRWTSSTMYAWVCLDRGVRLAELTGDDRPPLEEWRRARDDVHAELLREGWDEEQGAFVQAYGSTALDASLIRLPLLHVLPGPDPRVVSTLDRIDARLGDGPLVHRYDTGETDDGLDGPEGAFLLCSFDMAAALVLAGRADEARDRFEALCARAGDLGLYAEEMDAGGAMLGNYPQAFTHLALIEAALNIDQAGDGEALHRWASRGGH